jgi:hypothetical protein
MKYAEIFDIKLALEKLAKEPLKAAFEIAKDIRICTKLLDEGQELTRTLHAQFADRDEEGKIKQYEDEEKRAIAKISDPDKLKIYQEAIQKLNMEEHEVVFTKINKSKLETEKLSAEILIPLIDVIIVE